ncbi:3-alpha,7-alpha,12-alpha-trihydroxy-5-beta-cholest-24-enoyl-CoA hydratase [Lentzea guizhouensis]|uniref:3-alpha,7-alpha, 12-alpha-trihydroxy-5-beta-cholest-24-enoyl-CoA hydratase n=1 Tax=Lentzea guizhouensis TaxID=1586287 RepID=A0A1B2HTR5_9PSEU|nr:MaoC/PaaZ C-terminal domain-containing protein [Lentzea guizhouensis]ANZ41082.1 3-alpha,7-alpha,12-alpha-trihydroxy-5-beta-cholest-24-enoyl-CoA hydratase [Lentzea guizhouensis]
MPIDPDVAVGAELPELTFSWSSSDVLLYHLALGATELRYVYEEGLSVLPTFGVVAPRFHETAPPAVSFPGIDIDLAKVLHGTQEITVHGPIPADGEAVLRTRITDVWDKGKAAVVVQESTAVTADGTALHTTRSSIFARGEGGFGGERGPSNRVELPDREPDAVIETPTLPQQAYLYRLCGDRNPLHADPEFARRAGFDQPILHGLCTYGVVCKAVVDALLDGPEQVVSFGAKFAGVVFPGETLRTRVWRDGSRLVLTTSAGDRPVLADAVLVTQD